jgi:hypothetical protein
MNKQLERAMNLYVTARTVSEVANVDHWKGQVARTGNTGGRAQKHLDDAKASLQHSEEVAKEIFRAAVEAVEE